MTTLRRARTTLLLCTVVALASTAAPAYASHEQGGYFTATIAADGHLRGTLTYLYRGTCTTGVAAPALGFTLRDPNGGQRAISGASAIYSRCLPNSATIRTSFDVDLDQALGGPAPDGDYTLSFDSCCRVGGISNVSSPATQFAARVRKVAGQATGAPSLDSDVALGIAKNYAYSQNLNASDPDGGTLTYTSLAGQQDGPSYDVVSYSSTGQVTISAADTSTFNDGQTFVYKVRVSDDQGDFAERDVLLRVTANNAPPTIAGLEPSYQVAPGETRVVTFTATDPNNAAPKVDSVNVLASSLPAWATLQVTPGNPAQATLTLSPPAGLSPRTVGLNFDAVDDDAVAPLIGSANTQVQVTPLAPGFSSAPAAVSTTSVFSWTGPAGAAFECQVDDGAWAACASPLSLLTLADGSHTLRVRSTSQGVASEPISHGWMLDTSAPAASAIVGGPLGPVTDTDARFEFTGEPGAAFECRLDGGAWEPCVSPRSYAGLALGDHSFAVRQTDVAGNVSPEATTNWQVTNRDEPTPDAARVEVRVGSTIAVGVRSRIVIAGCEVPSGALRSCVVRAYIDSRQARRALIASAGRQVLVGTGRVTVSDGARRVAVRVKLNRAGRRAFDRLGGIRVRFRATATATSGAHLRATRSARLLPERTVVVPTSGLFASDSATLNGYGRRHLRRVAGRLGGVSVLSCVGHTDSMGAAGYNERLGLRRAQAVCARLRRLGVRVRSDVSSRGETRPRATNGTRAGRALNRRVELTVRYR